MYNLIVGILIAVSKIISFILNKFLLCQWMPLSSVAGVGVSPHVDTCQTSHHDSAKKKQSPQPETNSEYVHVSGFAGAVHAFEKIQKK